MLTWIISILIALAGVAAITGAVIGLTALFGGEVVSVMVALIAVITLIAVVASIIHDELELKKNEN